MATAATKGLLDAMAERLWELETVTDGLSEDDAVSLPPDEEWCVKEILSHLCGDEREDFVTLMRSLMAGEVPLTQTGSGLSYYTPQRQAMTVRELLAECRRRYEEAGAGLTALPSHHLTRNVHVPLLRESPLGERPTVEQLVGALLHVHLPDHIGQIRRVRGKLG